MDASMKWVGLDRSEPVRLDEQMTEMSLLLPVQQAEALSQAAQQRGVTMGRLVRELLQQACDAMCSPPFGGRLGNRIAD